MGKLALDVVFDASFNFFNFFAIVAQVSDIGSTTHFQFFLLPICVGIVTACRFQSEKHLNERVHIPAIEYPHGSQRILKLLLRNVSPMCNSLPSVKQLVSIRSFIRLAA